MIIMCGLLCAFTATAQVTFPSYSPTAASSIAVCSGEETLIIDFTVAQANSNGIEVKVKLADGIEYVSGTAVISATNGGAVAAVAVNETNVDNLNEPVFTVTSDNGNNEVEIGTIVKLTIKRRAVCTAWNNANTAAETGFVFKDKVTVTIDGNSTEKESNSYSVSYPNLAITSPAAQTNKEIGETITREFTITNGSQNPTGTVYLSIEYPDETYLTGTGAMELQAKLGASGTYTNLTPTATNGKVRTYTLSGATLGDDNQLTNGEIIYLKETFKLKTCNPSTTYRVGWGCSSSDLCEIKTAESIITMAGGAPSFNGVTYVRSNFTNLCNPYTLTLTYTNTGTGGTMGGMYDINLIFIGGRDNANPTGFHHHTFSDLKINGRPVNNSFVPTVPGTDAIDVKLNDVFQSDPDGEGVGLADLDGDGFYDDLPVGASVTLEVTVTPKQEVSCMQSRFDANNESRVRFRTACDTQEQLLSNKTPFPPIVGYQAHNLGDVSYLPANIEPNTPFDGRISFAAEVIYSPYITYKTRYRYEIELPAGLTVSDIKWHKDKYPSTIAPMTPQIEQTGNMIKITSPDSVYGYITFKSSYSCQSNNSDVTIKYKMHQIINIDHPDCLGMGQDLLCGEHKFVVVGCAGACPEGGVSSGIPVVERADNSLGWTDKTMTAIQSRSNISAYDLSKAMYLDEFKIEVNNAVQHGSAANLGARLELSKDEGDENESKKNGIKPLSADLVVTRGGSVVASGTVTDFTEANSTATEQVIDWDFTSLLPAGGLQDGDKIKITTHYRVISEKYPFIDQNAGKSWYIYNSDSPAGTNVWLGAHKTCLKLTPEMYLLGTRPIIGANPYYLEACNATDIGNFVAYLARRFNAAGTKYQNEYRPSMRIKKAYLEIPRSIKVNEVGYFRRDPQETQVTLTHESVTDMGDYILYVYNIPDNLAHFNTTVQNNYGATLRANVTATCATSDQPGAYEKVKMYFDYDDYYYHAASQPGGVPANLQITHGLERERDVIYSRKPSISLSDQTGLVNLAGKDGEWVLRFVNPSQSPAPYNWLALPNVAGLTINSVTTSDGTVITPISYAGGKMYKLSEAGIVAGASADYTIKFTYSGCSPATVHAMGGWNCSSFPETPDEYICNKQTVDLKLSPLETAMELSVVSVPSETEAATLCNTLEYTYSIQSTDNANVYNPTFNIFLEEGLTVIPNVVQVEYPAGSGTWEELDVVNNSVNLLQHPALATIGYLKGLKEAGADNNQRKIVVKFFIKTGCSFVSGKNFRVRADGRNACDRNAKGSGLAVSTPPIRIDGAIEPYTTSSSTQIITTTTSQYDCKDPKKVQVVHTIVGGTTTDKAYLEITLPLGFKYVTGSYAPDNTHPGGANALPAGSEVVTVTANEEDKIRINVKAGLTTGQSFAYTVDMKEDDNNAPACGNHTIEIVNVEEIEGLWCEGVQCTATYVTTGVNKFNFELDKPNLDITVGSATSVPTGGNENISIEYTVTNTSLLSLNAGTIVTLFSDKDGNQIYSTGDVIVGTQAIPTEVDNGTPFTQTMNVNGVNSANTENLFLTILGKDGCFCEVNTPNVVLEKLPPNYWIGGTVGKLNEWAEPDNWTNNYVPNATEDVEFATELNNPTVAGNPKSGPAKEDLHLDHMPQNGTNGRVIGNLINDSDKDLVVTTGNQLTINGQVLDNNPNAGTIVVQSLPDHPSGTLVFTNPAQNQNVGATVEFYNKGYDCADCGMYRRSWQYFGVPVQSLNPFPIGDVAGDETINQWTEPFNGNKWQTATLPMSAFKGYEITNSSNTVPSDVYKIKGTLFVGNATVPLTRTSGVNYTGANLVGNSYTAAIDIKEALTIPTEVQQTVYLFNTGTRDQWRKLDGSTVTGYQAGQYLAVPQNMAGQNNLPDRIPSMHAFMLRMESGSTANLGITYNKLVQNTTVNDGNGTQIAWRSGEPENEKETTMPSIVVDVLGGQSADRVWIFTKPESTFGYDNGWDGYKMKETDIAQLYTIGNTSDEKFQVATVPELENLLIGFDANADGRYTLEFALSDHFAESTIYLLDLDTGVGQPVENNAFYSFDARKGDTGARFKLSYQTDGNNDESRITVNTIGRQIVIINHSNQNYAASVFTVDGKLLRQIEVKAGSRETADVLDGVYIVRLQNGQTNVTKKVVAN